MRTSKTIITPSAATSINVRELWQHRELLYFFTWRDIKVKYKQTALGIFWVLLQPLALLLLFTFVFSRTSMAHSNIHLPYPLFVLSGLVLWNLFYTGVSHASDSMVANANIIRKIYFPRLIIPIATVLTALIDFVIAFIIFVVFCFIYHNPINWSAIFFFPAGIMLCLLVAFGFGTLLGALNVKYRDFRYALPFILQFFFFASQIIYSATGLSKHSLKYLLALNPINAAIELFRIPISDTAPDKQIIFIGILSGIAFTIFGLLYFRKTEAYFADII